MNQHNVHISLGIGVYLFFCEALSAEPRICCFIVFGNWEAHCAEFRDYEVWD